MKNLLFTFLFMIACVTVRAQPPVGGNLIGSRDIKDIKQYIGKEIIIVDSVYGGKAFENHTLLNIGGAHPNQLLTLFIAKKDYANFAGDVMSLYLHKKIDVIGKLTEFKDKLQIQVTDPQTQINQHPALKKGMHVVIIK